MAEIVIYPGSFNPVHNGHTAVAEYVAAAGFCDELWMMVSPQNPFKRDSDLAPEGDRLAMARIAIRETVAAQNVRVSEIELGLEKPTYTVDTLRHLGERYPQSRFSLLIGTDILPGLHRWRDAQYLLDNYRIYVYPRQSADYEKLSPGMTFLGAAPQVDVSSTAVRAALEAGDSLAGMLSPGVVSYIYDNGLWVADAVRRRVKRLDGQIAGGAAGAGEYLERGRLNYRLAEHGKALNDFIRAGELAPGNREAGEYVKLLKGIFEYRNMDIYNP